MTDSDRTPSEITTAVGNLIALITHAPACAKRLERLKAAEAAIEREGAEVAAARAENDRILKRINDENLRARTCEFQAWKAIDLLRDLLEEYRKTGRLRPLPENFESESAELIAAVENASGEWVAAAEERAAAAERARA
jgi:hypothetical protein